MGGYQQVIPPHQNVVVSKKELLHLQQRDKSIQIIAIIGRAEWKKKEGYHQRSNSEQQCSDTRQLLEVYYRQERYKTNKQKRELAAKY